MVCSVLSAVVLCHPGDSLREGRGGAYTLNHKYFPCQQLISLWFICKCEFAFYVFIFIYFIFAPRIQWVSLSSSSTLPCPALPACIYIYIFLASFSQRAEVWTCFLLLKHTTFSLLPSSFPFSIAQSGNSSPFCAVLSLGFLLLASRFLLLAFCSFRYVFFRFLVSTACSFFHIVFRRSFSLPCKTHNNHFNFNAPIIWK